MLLQILLIPLCSECLFIEGIEELSVKCCGNGREVILFMRNRENYRYS